MQNKIHMWDTNRGAGAWASRILTEDEEKRLCVAIGDCEYVFTSVKTCGRLRDVKKAFDTARTEAGISDFQLRDLRHSCGTRLSDQGEELVTVAEILGHTDIRMTKRYSHAMEERKRSALEKLVTFGSRQRDAKSAKNKKRQTAQSAVSA